MLKRKYDLFIDMDCTIYDLSKIVIQHYNIDYKDKYDYRQNKSYIWEETKAPPTYYEHLLNQPSLFYDGEPLDNADKILNKLHDEGFKIYFVSMPIWNKYCAFEKVQWLKKYFKWINPDTDIIFTGSKHLLDAPNRIIYDDNLRFLTWKKGIPICYAQGWNEGYEDSFRVHSHDEFYKLVHSLETLGTIGTFNK